MEASGTTFLRDTDVWSDLQPVPQNDGPNPVVPIAYSAKFEEAMGLFRAIQALDERSPRALDLTSIIIHLNSANYTVWRYRRLVLVALGSDLWDELNFVYDIAMENSKNYQLWHHRRWCAERLGKECGDGELAFTELSLSKDAKHYHAWAHRVWVLREYDMWEGELDFCSRLIQKDMLNNSAWNQRFTVIRSYDKLGGLAAMLPQEMEYVKKHIWLDTDNESPWRYLHGLYNASAVDMHARTTGGSQPGLSIQGLREFAVLVTEKNPFCVHALSLLLDLEMQSIVTAINDEGNRSKTEGGQDSGTEASEGTTAQLKSICRLSIEKGRRLCSRLQEIDPLRKKYWHFKDGQLMSIAQRWE
ncbi:hypothetical protein CBR_g21757 [Chara braunii]|uniref:Protein farnesyltransferase/geranylgeranyltransferase type-1 subunit alpha n=1 Tax=Chara braunii TaxID=69332 RepID=A0A388L1H0_CHABU|nr:hypothetical protein CBR_g21757 [Chara braunii]|eukprot:GBG76098.1 hypothetical protein CBR_g21757 [Chara braunii]